MSIYVRLLRSEDNTQYQEYLKILRSCNDAGVEIPEEVDKYFGGYGSDNDPLQPLEIPFKFEQWHNLEGSLTEGFDINLEELPEGVKTIRVFISWDYVQYAK